MWKKPLVVSGFAVYAVPEDRNHVFIRLLVKMVHLVSLVEDIRHQIRWWRIDDGRGNDVRNIPEVFVPRDVEFWIREKPAYRGEMDITTGCHVNL